jgi:putative transposase
MSPRGLFRTSQTAIPSLASTPLSLRRETQKLRERIINLAQRHRRYGAEMIYLKLRQAREKVNHKRLERLYALEKLQVRRRRRKKIPVAERQPLMRLGAANEVWSKDFLFDRVASGPSIKCLVITQTRTGRQGHCNARKTLN